jgi:hypothetical protein
VGRRSSRTRNRSPPERVTQNNGRFGICYSCGGTMAERKGAFKVKMGVPFGSFLIQQTRCSPPPRPWFRSGDLSRRRHRNLPHLSSGSNAVCTLRPCSGVLKRSVAAGIAGDFSMGYRLISMAVAASIAFGICHAKPDRGSPTGGLGSKLPLPIQNTSLHIVSITEEPREPVEAGSTNSLTIL